MGIKVGRAWAPKSRPWPHTGVSAPWGSPEIRRPKAQQAPAHLWVPSSGSPQAHPPSHAAGLSSEGAHQTCFAISTIGEKSAHKNCKLHFELTEHRNLTLFLHHLCFACCQLKTSTAKKKKTKNTKPLPPQTVGTLTCSSSLRSLSKNGFRCPTGLVACDKAPCRYMCRRMSKKGRILPVGLPMLRRGERRPECRRTVCLELGLHQARSPLPGVASLLPLWRVVRCLPPP